MVCHAMQSMPKTVYVEDRVPTKQSKKEQMRTGGCGNPASFAVILAQGLFCGAKVGSSQVKVQPLHTFT